MFQQLMIGLAYCHDRVSAPCALCCARCAVHAAVRAEGVQGVLCRGLQAQAVAAAQRGQQASSRQSLAGSR